MPKSNKIVAFVLKVGLALIALLVIRDAACCFIRQLTLWDLLLGFMGLVFVSIIAYKIREFGREVELRPHRGAERTPLLPPHEEG